MEKYHYRARNRRGELIIGEVDASDLKAARKLVSLQQLIPIEIGTRRGSNPLPAIKKWFSKKFDKVPLQELLIFNRQLQIIYSVGIPILDGLALVRDQTEHPVLRKTLDKIITDLQEGASLYQALAKHPDVFDSIYTNLIKVGEAAGELERILERISVLSEQQNEQRAKIKSAMFYPKIVIFVLVAVFTVVVYFVLPRMKSFYAGFGGQLPPVTRFVMGVSDFFTTYWYLVFAIVYVSFTTVKKFLSTDRGRMLWDKYVLKMPIFGQLLLQIEISSFCTILEILMESGLPIVESLKLVSGSLTNKIVALEVDSCRTTVEAGGKLAEGFKDAGVTPKIVRNLLTIGEEGGQLPKVLNRVTAYYKVQIDYKLNNLSKLIEPILLVLVFGMVLVLALAVFMPMWKMSGLLKR
jgi:type II secretory pathway component PulF